MKKTLLILALICSPLVCNPLIAQAANINTLPDRRFTKGLRIFTPLVATQAKLLLPNYWCSCSKTKMRLF